MKNEKNPFRPVTNLLFFNKKTVIPINENKSKYCRPRSQHEWENTHNQITYCTIRSKAASTCAAEPSRAYSAMTVL